MHKYFGLITSKNVHELCVGIKSALSKSILKFPMFKIFMNFYNQPKTNETWNTAHNMRRIVFKTENFAGKTLYRALSLHILMVGETFIWTVIWKNLEDLITFLKGRNARHGSSLCPPALNKNGPLNSAPLVVTKRKRKK